MHILPFKGVGCASVLSFLVAVCPAWAAETGGMPDVYPSPDVSSPPVRQPSSTLSPSAAVVAALDNNPRILEAEAAVALARGAAAEAALLQANPDVGLETSVDGARRGFDLQQPLSLTGVGPRQRAWASARTDATVLALERARLSVAAEVRIAYADAVVAVRSVAVAGAGLELANRLQEAVQRQFDEGEASALDVRLARLAVVKAASRLLEARQVEGRRLQALAGIIGRSVGATALLDDPLVVVPEPTSARSLSLRSDVRAAEEGLRAAEADLRRQRAASVPPVRVGVFLDVEDGQSYIGPSLGFELPVFQRNQAGRAGAGAQVQVARAALAATTARAETELVTSRRRVMEVDALSERFTDDPIEDARRALESIHAGYLSGEIDLPSTVLLQAEVLSGEAAAIELLGQVCAARIDLLLATEDTALIGGAP